MAKEMAYPILGISDIGFDYSHLTPSPNICRKYDEEMGMES